MSCFGYAVYAMSRPWWGPLAVYAVYFSLLGWGAQPKKATRHTYISGLCALGTMLAVVALALAYPLDRAASELRAVLLSDMRVRKFDKFECPTGCSVTSASVHGDPMFKVNGIAAGAKDELA